ncbi:MAG: biopolymer transporter ExbD [Desulfobulbus oligotrophicus]|jgi:biopolymer transport protein ExbD|nr:biopolymer transporter ExbD [Desulfobulbus oligotrophicus]
MSETFSFEDEIDANIDLTPLIDTVFMLLIFFIMATSFSKPVLEVALQEAQGAVVQEREEEPLTITVTGDGRIMCNDEETSLEDFESVIAARPEGEAVVFNVDKTANFGIFVRLLDIAKKNGQTDFAIITAQEEKP